MSTRATLALCLLGSALLHSADPTIDALWTEEGPTAAEIENLCLLNRFRADPRAEADRIIVQAKAGRGIDWGTFRTETDALEAVPPAVWNQELTIAAHQHIRHLLATRGRGHGEKPGQPCFVDASHTGRMKKAGYAGKPTSENWAGWDDPSSAHVAWIIDSKGRDVGHRRAMIARGNMEIGIAMGGQGLQNFGSPRGKGLLVGVVVYVDGNKDGRYSAGEGIADVNIASDGVEAQTDASGYARLELPAGAQGPVMASRGSVSFATAIDTSQRTMHWEVQANDPQRRSIEKLIKQVQRAGTDEAKRRKAAIALALGADDAFMDQKLTQTVWDLAGAECRETQSLHRIVFDDLASDPADIIEQCAQWQQDWQGTPYDKVIAMVEQMALAHQALSAGDDTKRKLTVATARKVFLAVGKSCPDPRIALRAQAEALLLGR